MGLVSDLIYVAGENVKETLRPQKTEAKPNDEARLRPHDANQNADIEKQDVPQPAEKDIGVPAQPVENEEDEAATKKRVQRERIFKIVTIYGFITSIIALAQAVKTKQSDPLILSNIILTFGAAVLNFLLYMSEETPKAVLIAFVSLIFVANLAGIGVCIALLVRDGASYSWILTLVFHVIPVVLIPYLACEAMGKKK